MTSKSGKGRKKKSEGVNALEESGEAKQVRQLTELLAQMQVTQQQQSEKICALTEQQGTEKKEKEELSWEAKAKEQAATEPLCKVPPGLDKMLKSVLESEMESRGLAVAPKMTRPQMILAIREQAEHRSMLLLRDQSQSSKSAGSEVTGIDPMETDSEWIRLNKRAQ